MACAAEAATALAAMPTVAATAVPMELVSLSAVTTDAVAAALPLATSMYKCMATWRRGPRAGTCWQIYGTHINHHAIQPIN